MFDRHARTNVFVVSQLVFSHLYSEETLCVEIIAYIPACSDEKTMLRKLVTFEEMRLLSVICSFGSFLPYDTVCVLVCAACVPERFELCSLHGCCFSL